MLYFIKEKFFIDHSHFSKMLDPGNTVKQSHRTYISIKVIVNNNIFYLPLRKNLGADIRPYGRIGHSVPSASKPNAGIDYRYALIVNDNSYLEKCLIVKLPNSQIRTIYADYNDICQEFEKYLEGYIKTVLKNRLKHEPLYRESCLVNFNDELGLSNT